MISTLILKLRLASLGGAGAHPSLEVPVRCDLAFHVPNGIPQRPRPRPSDQYSDLKREVPLPPFKTVLRTARGGSA
jgi:hypothetical protein